MPPQLALLFCIVFVLFLLWLGRKQGPEVSHVLWIPTIWMLFTASKPLGIWFTSSGADPELGSPLDRLFLSGLLCLGLFILARRKFDWSSAIKEHIWLMLLVGYMLVSILWSEIPFISFKRWIRVLVAVVMAFLVLSEPSPRQAMESLLRRTAYILIPFSLLLIKYFSEYGRQYDRWSGELMWIGVTLQKNGLGRLCMIAALFLSWALIRRRQGRDIPVRRYQTHADVFVLLLTLYLLKGPPHSYPATAFAALAIGLATFLGLSWMKKRRMIIRANILETIIVFIISFGIVTVFIGGSNLSDFAAILGRDETLTGRTGIWAKLLSIAMRQPVLGHGFGGFWTPSTTEVYASEAHSGYLEVLLHLGFVGILLFSMFLLSCCRKAHRKLAHDFDWDWGSLWISYLVMALLHNITESSLNNFSNHLMAVLLFLAVSSETATSCRPGVSREV